MNDTLRKVTGQRLSMPFIVKSSCSECGHQNTACIWITKVGRHGTRCKKCGSKYNAFVSTDMMKKESETDALIFGV